MASLPCFVLLVQFLAAEKNIGIIYLVGPACLP
jgi:hypothetical protein